MQNWSASSFPTTFTSLSRSHGELSTRQSEILQPVQNPNLPYVAPISGGLREGMALYLKGVIPTNAERFEINFKTGQSDSDDTAFHFNPRLHQKVVMNSFRNRKWEAKERACPHTGCVALVYQVYVNGKELYTFKHRIPLEKVSTLNISGHVVVSLFGFMQVSYIFYMHLHFLQHSPNLPYVAPISGGLREGMALYLKGVIPTNSDSDDTAFHFNPRLHQKVVMNSFRNRKWEAKESVSDNPFKKGETFEMFTVIKSEGYQVYVNGKELYTFKHRIPLEKVSTLNISGHVVVSLFGFMQVSYIFYSC
uniref:Galectin n=1 Tax=Cyprinus carpio TaxID=7962 RepID=A0A8C2Q518_CYPCA